MRNKFVYVLASAALLASGCSKEDRTGEPYGQLHISGTTVDAVVETRAAYVPSAEEFYIRLTDADGQQQSWKTVAEYHDALPLLKEGNYNVIIYYGNHMDEGVNKPYYEGEESIFVRRRIVTEVEMTAKIDNSQTVVRATEQFLKYFHDAKFTVTTESHNSFTFTPGAATPDEPVWVRRSTKLTVTGTAKRQSPTGVGTEPVTTFTEQVLASTKPATCHIFTFGINGAGSATLEITLGDGLTETRTLDIEMNDDAIED